MDKKEMQTYTKQQVETIMLILTKLLVQSDLQLYINKKNGDFIFEKNDTDIAITVDREAMSDFYNQQVEILVMEGI